MQTTDTPFYILQAAHGDYSLLAGTREAALALYHENKEYLVRDAQALVAYFGEESPREILGNPETLIEGLSYVLNHSESSLEEDRQGQAALRFLLHGARPKACEDIRPMPEVTADMQAETVLWVAPYVKGASLRGWKELLRYALLQKDAHPEAYLSYLTGFRERVAQTSTPIRWMYPEYFDIAKEARVIEKGRWNESASEERIVSRILEFVNAHLTHRDVRYSVVRKPGT
jgi:hypothetical protein